MRRRRELGRLAATGLAVATVAGCAAPVHQPASTRSSAGSTASGRTTAGAVTIGAVTVSGGYIPRPASPDVAAAYLTITNTGGTADVVTRITTSVTSSVMAMTETAGNGVGTMTYLGPVTVPAHGQVTFTPGHAHLMLENPNPRLRAGQHVRVTITFRHAGTADVTLPVVPLAGAQPSTSTPG